MILYAIIIGLKAKIKKINNLVKYLLNLLPAIIGSSDSNGNPVPILFLAVILKLYGISVFKSDTPICVVSPLVVPI
jgi:hypothetical protein